MPPYCEIYGFVVPASLPEGSAVTVTITLRNAGTESGYLDYYIDGNPADPDRITQVEAGRSLITVAPGVVISFNVPIRYFPMPGWDFTLTASNEDGTSSISKTILVGAGIHTTTTINVPESVGVGEIFTVYGNLFETETDILIPGMRINLSYNGKSLGYVYTGPEGDYYKDVSINEGGVWSVRAEFPGTETLQASSSVANAIVAATPLEAAIAIVGSAATGLAMLAYGLG